MEGSAVAAIGTDTGGSIRVPAALCGLAGYRASLGHGDWRGGAHLAQSFDTLGWLFRDLEDAPLLADFLAPAEPSNGPAFDRFAVIDESFLHDCEPEIVDELHVTARELESLGLRSFSFDPDWWAESFEIFAPIQAWEAARLHADHFDQFEASIRQRLEWGASITEQEVSGMRLRHDEFRTRIDELLAEDQLLLLPASPVARLTAGADHGQTRKRLLRYTTPFSLAGVPVVNLPCAASGMQLAAARGRDEALVVLAARIGAQRRNGAQNS
jgi:aspartyl-tRNA(Asn)/glutamyl-tRNA(Gln) amidotransferase subunit A